MLLLLGLALMAAPSVDNTEFEKRHKLKRQQVLARFNERNNINN